MRATSDREWSQEVSAELAARMDSAALACYENGIDLLADAELLFEASRWPRAAAVAILAEEEFSKAFILRVCARERRWDSNIFAALRKHASKQGVAQAMRDWVNLVVSNALRVEEMNKYALIPTPPGLFLSEEDLDPIFDRARQIFRSPQLDYLKQGCFYVNVDKNAGVTKVPRTTSADTARQCLTEAKRFKAALDLMAGDPKALDEWR